jgi:hypothetical protein
VSIPPDVYLGRQTVHPDRSIQLRQGGTRSEICISKCACNRQHQDQEKR